MEANNQTILVALNLRDGDAILPAPGAKNVLAGTAATITTELDRSTAIRLPGYGWAVLSTEKQ
jgi:cyclomaltodextrinase